MTFLDDSRARRTRPRHLGGRQLENRRRADLGDGGLLSATEIGVLGCPHWHIDYLRRYTRLEAVWYSSGARCEHECAAVIAGLPGAVGRAGKIREFGLRVRDASVLVRGIAARSARGHAGLELQPPLRRRAPLKQQLGGSYR